MFRRRGKRPRRSDLTAFIDEGSEMEGRYTFRKLGPESTEATCRQEIKLGFWVPGPLRKLAERTALKQSVSELKAEVERQVATAKKPARSAKADGAAAKRKR